MKWDRTITLTLFLIAIALVGFFMGIRFCGTPPTADLSDLGAQERPARFLGNASSTHGGGVVQTFIFDPIGGEQRRLERSSHEPVGARAAGSAQC